MTELPGYVQRCYAWAGRYVTKYVSTRAGNYWIVEQVVAVERHPRDRSHWIVRLKRVDDNARSVPPGTRTWVGAEYFDREVRPDSSKSQYRETLTG